MKIIISIIIGLMILGIIGTLVDSGGEKQRPVRTEYMPGGGLKCVYADGYTAIIKSGGCPSLR